MAFVDESIFVDGARGKVNKAVYRRWKGHTVLSRVPARAGELKPNQKAQCSKFKEAVAYAVEALKDTDLREQYLQKGKNKQLSAYNMAIADFLTPPVIDAINTENYKGAIGNKISITVTDNFKVTSVLVKIQKPDDTLIESGNAVLKLQQWVYTTTVANPDLTGCKIVVEAKDTPAHTSEKEVLLT